MVMQNRRTLVGIETVQDALGIHSNLWKADAPLGIRAIYKSRDCYP